MEMPEYEDLHLHRTQWLVGLLNPTRSSNSFVSDTNDLNYGKITERFLSHTPSVSTTGPDAL